MSPVSVTMTTVPTGSVTILRPRWVSQKKIGPSRWHDAAMKRLAVLVLTAALLLAGGAASAVVKNGGPGDDKLQGHPAARTRCAARAATTGCSVSAATTCSPAGPATTLSRAARGSTTSAAGTGDDRVIAGFDNLADRTYGGPGNDVIFIFGTRRDLGGRG